MILTTLQQMVADFCGDPDQTRFGAKYVGNVNRAQEQFAMDTKALWKDASYTTVSGTSTYALPSDFLWEDTVTHAGLPLKPISRHSLYALYPSTDWTQLEGTPTHFLIDPEEASKVLRLIPIPQDAETVSMRYFPLPAAVSGGNDVVLNSSALMSQFHMAIAALAAWLTLTFETPTPEISDKRRELMKIYSDGVGKAVDTFKNTASEPLRLRPK